MVHEQTPFPASEFGETRERDCFSQKGKIDSFTTSPKVCRTDLQVHQKESSESTKAGLSIKAQLPFVRETPLPFHTVNIDRYIHTSLFSIRTISLSYHCCFRCRRSLLLPTFFHIYFLRIFSDFILVSYLPFVNYLLHGNCFLHTVKASCSVLLMNVDIGGGCGGGQKVSYIF